MMKIESSEKPLARKQFKGYIRKSTELFLYRKSFAFPCIFREFFSAFPSIFRAKEKKTAYETSEKRGFSKSSIALIAAVCMVLMVSGCIESIPT
ncbi:MAG: hypothetical protein HZB66_01235, partial [Candidatus Aenigmarchaeota archaeon]|nr:hypothetical protein [Candidatus Aenigmarchaeota archaeon]